MQIAKTISALREKLGLSQDALAERLYVSRELVSKWENGTRRPTREMLERLSEILGVSTETLMQEDERLIRELEGCLPASSPLSKAALVPILNAFLSGLRVRDADLFMQRYYYTKSMTEIASRLGMKENHARAVLSRIRKKLAIFIKEKMHESQ